VSQAGVEGRLDQLWGQFAVGLFKAGFILVGLYFLDRRGRRPLLLLSVALVTLCLCGLAVGFALDAPPFWTIGTLCVYMAAFSIGEGPVTWVVTSEVFPYRLRSKAAAVATLLNRGTSGIVASTFLSFSDAVTSAGAFAIFAVISSMHFVFVYCCLPETKGRTLEEIAVLFGDADVATTSHTSPLSSGACAGSAGNATHNPQQAGRNVVLIATHI
jgi:MFS family permease